MADAHEIVAAAAVLLAQQVQAAAVFGLADDASTVLLLAVTAEDFHLLDWADGRCTRELARFPREATHVQIRRSGISRRVRLDDPRSGAAVELTGAASSPSGPTRVDAGVLALLAGDAA